MHLVGFVIRIYQDASSTERQRRSMWASSLLSLALFFKLKFTTSRTFCTANLSLLLGFTTPSNISYRIIHPAEMKTQLLEGFNIFVSNLHLPLKSNGVSKYPKSSAQTFKLITFYVGQQTGFYFNLKLLFCIIENNMAVPNVVNE